MLRPVDLFGGEQQHVLRSKVATGVLLRSFLILQHSRRLEAGFILQSFEQAKAAGL